MGELLILGIGIGTVGLVILTVVGVYAHLLMGHKHQLEELSDRRKHARDILRTMKGQLDAIKDLHENPEDEKKSIQRDNPGMEVDVHESLSWHLRVASDSIQNVISWIQ